MSYLTTEIMQTHVIERRSPKGDLFIGTCLLCGRTGLKMAAARLECDNPRGLSPSEALVEAIDGPTA